MADKMKAESVNQEYPRATALLLCREVSKSAAADGLLSLVNVFGNINIKGDIPLSNQPINLFFWVYIEAEDQKPRDKYELIIEVHSPKGEMVLAVQVLLENPFLSPHISGAQSVAIIINQEGNYVFDLKLQNRIIGKKVLTVTRT